MSSLEPIDLLVKALEDPEGPRNLDGLRRILGLPDQKLSLFYDRLGSKDKTFRVYAAEAPGGQGKSIVVKFNPLGTKDPYLDDVYKDYRILDKLRPLRNAPEPLFCSSFAEERVVGTAFIAMSFVEGRICRTVREVPNGKVIALFLVIMKKLAEVHGTAWGDRELPARHDNTWSFWQEVVDEVKANYRSIVGFWKWWFWFLADPESYLFSLISGGRKPISKKRIGIVHGSLDIGNFIFNPELTEVRAILNWKYEQNGDGLIDVASLLLAFLDIGSYGVSIPQRLVYPATKQEVDEVVTEYRRHAKNVFSDEEVEFAKAVCFLKMICVVKRGVYDNFAGHELGRFPEITDNPDIVINLLWRHAKQSYREFSL